MSENLYIFLAVISAAIGTALSRFPPYFLLKNAKESKMLKYLQDTMPLLIITILVFFTLKDVKWAQTYGIYEILGITSSILCFVISKNSVISIFLGLAFYMTIIRIF